MVYKVWRNSINPVYEVANHLLEWAQQGMTMVPICDGETWPVAKQASNKNHAKRVKNKHNDVINHQELRVINRQLEDCGNETERNKLMETCTTMERNIKSAETQSKNNVPPNFADLLQKELEKISAGTPGSIVWGVCEQSADC